MKKSRVKLLLPMLFISLIQSYGQYSFKAANTSSESKKYQSAEQIKSVKIGDRIPDYFLEEVLNYKKQKAYLFSEFKGKYLLLDFWATFCAPCIAKFPELNAIQEKFRDKLTILAIGIDGPGTGTIKRFIDSNKETKKKLVLPTAVIKDPLNSDFVKFFPFTNLPHEIWIDPNGYVIAITGAFAVTEKNIEEVLKGNRPSFEEKKMLRNVDFLESFLVNSPRNSNNLKRTLGSAFSGYNDSLFTYNPLSLVDTSVFHLTILNQTKIQLYTTAYNKIGSPWINGHSADKRVIDESTGVSLYYKDYPNGTKMDNWEFSRFKENNLFCYELILPRKYSNEQIYSSMVNDLDRYFNAKSYPAEVKMKCLALVNNKNSTKAISIGSTSDITDTDSTIRYEGQPIQFVIDQLNGAYKYSPLIIDQSGITKNISIIVTKASSSIDQLRSDLRKYDLDLEEKELMIKVLMIKSL